MRRPIADWPTGFDNSLPREGSAEERGHRTVAGGLGAHFTRVRPTVSSPNPTLVLHSDEVAASLGLGADDCASPDASRGFPGLAAGDGGDVGDGVRRERSRAGTAASAATAARLRSASCTRKKSSSRAPALTPFSRQFDGRAVLRSCVREFLASEHMAALGVPTTRALAVVTTGEDVVRRWYDDDGRERIRAEPGAVGTRVATSFLRFGQMELFFQRDEPELLRELADHALRREFGHLMVQKPRRAARQAVRRDV